MSSLSKPQKARNCLVTDKHISGIKCQDDVPGRSETAARAISTSKYLCARCICLFQASRCRLGPKKLRLTDKHDESILKWSKRSLKRPTAINGAMTSSMKNEARKKQSHFKKTRLTLLTKLMTSTSYKINYIFSVFLLWLRVPVTGRLTFGFSAKKPLRCVPSGEQKRNYRKLEKLTRKMTLQNSSRRWFGRMGTKQKECHVRCQAAFCNHFDTI